MLIEALSSLLGRDDVPAIDSDRDTVLWGNGYAGLHVIGDTADELREVGGVRHCVIDGGQTACFENIFYVEHTVERVPHMEIVQIVLDKKLLYAGEESRGQTVNCTPRVRQGN
jgi:hypothetical protein